MSLAFLSVWLSFAWDTPLSGTMIRNPNIDIVQSANRGVGRDEKPRRLLDVDRVKIDLCGECGKRTRKVKSA